MWLRATHCEKEKNRNTVPVLLLFCNTRGGLLLSQFRGQ